VSEDPRKVVLEIGRALVESHEASTYRTSSVDLADYTRVVREMLVTRDRFLRAEIDAWAERAIACEPRVAVSSLEQILFPRYQERPLEAPVERSPARTDRHVLGWSMLAIAAIAVAGSMLAEREGVTFTFDGVRPEITTTMPATRVPLAPIALGSEPPDESDDCIATRNHACVREHLLPRLGTLSRDRTRALRIACAALADYGCVLRVDSLRDR
jgi:hypothetical protein